MHYIRRFGKFFNLIQNPNHTTENKVVFSENARDRIENNLKIKELAR